MTAMPALLIEHLSVRFGGLVAVDDLSLSAPAATVTGVIGPNGAGKTTTFNACTGTVPMTTGHIQLGDHELDGLSTSSRAALGLGRTFQRMELFDSMTVADNVALGAEAFFSSVSPVGQLRSPRRERQSIRDRAADAVARCGIEQIAHRIAGDLSTGQRRLVELARAIATPFRFLLLDEPSSGLDAGETARFGEIVRQFVADTGIGLLLVEHDMSLVAAVCSYLFVLDFGQLIFSGTTEDALASDIVRAAYLGTGALSREGL
jgi:ABC-type branched-subunit amino acid transport system ATPase component